MAFGRLFMYIYKKTLMLHYGFFRSVHWFMCSLKQQKRAWMFYYITRE